MVFNVYEIVHHLSKVMTLEPCDIIATGTPAGVGFAIKPKPKFLKNGRAHCGYNNYLTDSNLKTGSSK